MSATPSRRLTALFLGSSVIAALALLNPASEAKADKVGVAAAVKPDAFSQGTEVKIGNSIFYNQRINTTGSGLVQVLLVDGSTFTVGPGSDLVIDKFVYDPNKKQGEVVASFSKGVLRFVGGKISKNEGGVTVNTPTGALAIRGGMFQGSVSGGKTIFSFLFGVEMKFTGKNGQISRVYQPGYTFDNGLVRPTRPDDTQFFMKALAGGGHVVVGGSHNGNKPEPKGLFQNKTAEVTEEGTQNVITANLEHEEEQVDNPAPPTAPTKQKDDDMRVMMAPKHYSVQMDSVTIDDLGEGEVRPGDRGVLGGSDHVDTETGELKETVDDFTVHFKRVDDRLIGSFKATRIADDDQHALFAKGTISLPAEFSEGVCTEFGACISRVTDAELNATVSGPDGDREEHQTFKGSVVAVGSGFVAYQLFKADDPDAFTISHGETNFNNPSPEFNVGDYNPDLTYAQRVSAVQGLRELIGAYTGIDLNSPVLMFTGKEFAMRDSGKVREFQLLTDPRQSIVLGAGDGQLQTFVVPFATQESSPVNFGNGANASVSNLAVLQKTSNDPQSRSVWLQTSLFVNDDSEGNDQESIVVVALGEMKTQGGSPGLVGNRRGGSDIALNPFGRHSDHEALAFTGGISTLAAANGAHFLGNNTPNIVIGANSTDPNHDIFLDKPLSNDSDDVLASATYHVGVGAPTTKKPTQTSGIFQGYAAGVVQTTSGHLEGDEAPVGALVSNGPSDVTISFNAKRNTLSATLITHMDRDPDDGGMNLVLGDTANTRGRSAFIDDNHYAAIERPHASSVRNAAADKATLNSAPTGYLVSGEQLGVTKFFQDSFATQEGENATAALGNDPLGKAFCKNCEFIKWGAWGARAGFKDGGGNDVTANVHLGWWVAGNITSASELDNLATQGATATYAGNAIGNVANNLNGRGWKTYVAAGDMDMSWSFAARQGELNITNFDQRHIPGGLDFSAPLTAPGVIGGPHFSGNLGLTTELPTNLSQLNGLSGVASGSFVRGPGDVTKGVIGNWNVNNNQYGATGIFAGSKIPR